MRFSRIGFLENLGLQLKHGYLSPKRVTRVKEGLVA